MFKTGYFITAILLVLLSLPSFGEEKGLELFRKAVEYEKNHDYEQAAKYYYKCYLENKNEKLLLKSARITPDINESIDRYSEFLKNFPVSRFRHLARYEFANLLLVDKQTDRALDEFGKLLKLSRGTIYWGKSLVKTAVIYCSRKDYREAVKMLSQGMDSTEDYETHGEINYLFGKIYLDQSNYDEAEHYFLIVAGSFSDCGKAPASLMELVKIYIRNNDYGKAKRAYRMLCELYPDSFEKAEADSTINKINDKIRDIREEELTLINLNKNPNIAGKDNKRLKDDLELSSRLDIYPDDPVKNIKSDDTAGYYIQLSYLSSKENALKSVADYKSAGINDVFYARTRSSESSKILYRVLIGPFGSKEKASARLIELKEKNIEAIILELDKEYE